MMKVAVVVVLAACCLPANVLSIWPTNSYYIDFLVTKNCFGEEIALQREKFGLEIGWKCWKEEWKNSFGWPVEEGARKKRSIIKIPSAPSERLLECNLRGMELLTEDDELDYDALNLWVSAMVQDPEFKEQLIELSLECQHRPSTFPGLPMKKPSEPPLRGVLAFSAYMDCMNPGLIKICRNKERKRLQKILEKAQTPHT